MKVLQINTFYIHGSTGRIVFDLMDIMEQEGIDAFAAYGQNRDANKDKALPLSVIRLQGQMRRKLNILLTRVFDHHGFYNQYETTKLLKWIDDIKPDIIHLHNIHNHYLHVGRLFEYIKEKNIPIVWTLHDCWPFTGHCAYFDYANCNKWEKRCNHCPSLKNYPTTWFFDFTNRQYEKKKEVFNNVRNLVIVSPSQWLANLCKRSFLQKYPIKVINNGIDTDILKPINNNVRNTYGIGKKKMILAIAPALDKRKGGEYLLKLPLYLNEDEILILIGVNQDQMSLLPHNGKVIGLKRTASADELVGFYTAADVYVNTTLEDNFPTTNIEALACGTPIVTFNTGGAVEAVLDGENVIETRGIQYSSVGAVVPQGNIETLLFAVREICSKKNEYKEICRKKALERYNKASQYKIYLELYKSILNSDALYKAKI